MEQVYFYPEGHEKHFKYGHPERPERLDAVCDTLQAAGWWEPYPRLEPVVVSDGVLTAIHNPAYLKTLEQVCGQGNPLDQDTYTTPASWQLALNTAGGACAVAGSVWERTAQRGFALTRPPGHHATSGRGMGFCLLNNVALAAEYLLQIFGAQRLAIVDLVLHHGNGTQDIFWRRGDVFYISTHQMPLYPGSGYINESGAGEGTKKTANIPLPPGSGDQSFEEALESIILPLLDRCQPQMLLVSVGFDTHWRDPLGSLQLSAQGYRDLVYNLSSWADRFAGGRISLFLEGGYDLDAMGACAQACVAGLLDLPWQDPLGISPYRESQEWQAWLEQVRLYWDL